MTQPFDDEYGDRLRRALHAEAEAVTPSPEGLERIRSKVNQRRERRFGLITYSIPWLRPLAAVTAALTVCLAAVSVTPALANFVQTGHFSPDSGGSDHAGQNDGRTRGELPPGQSSAPVPGGSRSPSSPVPSPTVPNGACPSGQVTVSPSAVPAPVAGQPSTPTCESPTSGVPGGDDPTSVPTTEAPPPPPPSTSVPADPPTEPSESAPAAAPNSNSSP